MMVATRMVRECRLKEMVGGADRRGMWATRAEKGNRAGVRRGSAGAGVDHGFSLVEVVISIALLGLGTVATLGAMVASVDASAEQRDLANAQTWLQGAADYLQGQPRQDCDNVNGVAGEAEARIRGIYQGDVQTVSNPAGWPAGEITVLQPVLFWDGDQYQSTCHDDDGINLQLVTLQVKSPNGKLVRTLQVIRGA